MTTATSTSLNLHVMIAVDARDGAMLGPVHAEFLRHEGGKRDDCGKRPFEEKESFRWLAATREAAKLAKAGAERITVVADRECDIYDEFALRPAETDLVIRVHHNRLLADGRWLFDRPRRLPELGRETISLPAAPGRPARDAIIALRACPVTLKRPMRNRATETAKLPPKVHLTLVEAREIRPPRNVTPAHWLLLTTHPVTSFNDARGMTRAYRGRWTIEQVNRTMKTEGFRIEASRLADGGPFENLAAAVLIAAVQVMQLVGDRDGTAGRPLEDVFDPPINRRWKRFAPPWKATPHGKRTRTNVDRWPTPPGFARGWLAGPFIMANRVPWSFCADCCCSRPCVTPADSAV